MIANKLVLLLSVLLIIQAPFAFPTTNYEKENGIINIAEIALKFLEAVVDGVTRASLITINSLESSMISLERLILKLAENEINRLGDQLFEKINELKKGANIIAVDVIECTEDREEDLKEILISFVNQTGDCAVKRINEVLDSFETVMVDIQDINAEVKNITAQLVDCETDSNVTECVDKVIKDIEQAIVKQEKITDDVEMAKKRVNELINYLFECEHDYINELEIKSQEIYNGIVECVENKIHPNIIYIP